MAGNLTPVEIAALPDVYFGEAWLGDFIEVEPGLYKEILYVTWYKEGHWSVTTADKVEYRKPEAFRYKKNPFQPDGPAFL